MSDKGKLVGILVQKFNKLVKLKLENTEGTIQRNWQHRREQTKQKYNTRGTGKKYP